MILCLVRVVFGIDFGIEEVLCRVDVSMDKCLVCFRAGSFRKRNKWVLKICSVLELCWVFCSILWVGVVVIFC